MPCNVTADRIEIRQDGSVRVFGLFEGQLPFFVSVVELTVSKAAILAAPNWSVVFSGAEVTGDLARFRNRHCSGGPDRFAEYSVNRPLPLGSEFPGCRETGSAPVQCETPEDEPGACPDVTVTVEPGSCNKENTERLMTFEVTVGGGATIEYRWAFGDGTPLTPPATGSGIFSDPHFYAADDTYYASLIIVDPPGCTATPDPITVVVEPCGEQACPEIRWSADIAPESECQSGRRTVIVTATIVLPGQSISASMLDDQGQVIASGTQDDDLTLESPALRRGGGDYDFSLQFDGNLPDDCRPDLQHTVSVPDCPPGKQECPTVDWNVDVSPDCNEDGTRDVTVVASVTSSGAPVTAELRDPQGNVLDTGTTPANGPATLDSGAMTLTPGNHQFSVAFIAGLPRGCAVDDTNVVTVPACGGEGGGGGGGSESFGCMLLRVIALFFLITGLVAIVGGACSNNTIAIGAGVVAALFGVALLLTWAWLCAPEAGCLALQRVIGIVNLLITVFAAIALIIAAIVAILALLGVPGITVGLPCFLGAAVDTVILAGLQLILMQFFLSQGCQWQGQSIYG